MMFHLTTFTGIKIMGSSSWNHDDWKGYSTRTASKSTNQIFTSRGLDDSLNPNNFTVRESRDSDAHPNSTPIIVALDVTASMGMVATSIAQKGLGVLVEEILNRKPVTDPHVLIAGIGDANYDNAPLQATQFEADTIITDQIEKIYLEGGGGGNGFESYDLAWFLAGFKTATDSMDKRSKKGYLFTVGDEEIPHGLTMAQIQRFTGQTTERDMSAQELLDSASRMYECFHVVVEEGHHVRQRGLDRVMESWSTLLGERALPLSDHTKLAEVVVSAIQMSEGTDHSTVAGSWSGDTSLVVANATKSLSANANNSGVGVTRL